MLNDTQKRAFRAWRKRYPKGSAKALLDHVRAGRTVPGTRLETSGHRGHNGGTRIQYWEHRADVPFRFTGYCDEIRRSIGHTGWYCDEHQERALRGVVYQIPARNGVPQYLSGYQESDNDSVVLYLDSFEAEPAEAAHHADEHARICAESEREYSESWSAGSQAGQAVQEALDALRDEVSRIVQIALYPDRAGLTVDDDASADRQYEEARDALRDAIRAARDGCPSYSQGLRDAYREGMEITRIKAIGGGIEL